MLSIELLVCRNTYSMLCQVVPLWVDFSSPVEVIVPAGASPPQLALGELSATAYAEYVGGSGNSQLQFEYTVRAAHDRSTTRRF